MHFFAMKNRIIRAAEINLQYININWNATTLHTKISTFLTPFPFRPKAISDAI